MSGLHFKARGGTAGASLQTGHGALRATQGSPALQSDLDFGYKALLGCTGKTPGGFCIPNIFPQTAGRPRAACQAGTGQGCQHRTCCPPAPLLHMAPALAPRTFATTRNRRTVLEAKGGVGKKMHACSFPSLQAIPKGRKLTVTGCEMK